jgi:hypothetical protein
MKVLMFERLKQLAKRLMAQRPPPWGPSADPYAGVRQPRKHGPRGRDAAVAVAEPDEDGFVRAVGPSGREEHRR